MHPNKSNWQTALERANSCLRCGAKTRKGTPCQSPAMSNERCRMHGGTAGAPSGKRNGNYKHGSHTKARLAEMAMLRRLLREAREILN